MFHQLLTPVQDSLLLSFLVASVPIAIVLVLLGIIKAPAWVASLVGLIAALGIAVYVWKFPLQMALESTAAGAVFAVWPVMWIVFNALVLYNIAVQSGRFDAFRRWVVNHLPNDRRIVLVVIGFSFGALLEGVCGFGTPVAITSALLIALGFPALEAIVFTLLFNTAPVAFGAMGVPVTTLGAVTGLPNADLGSMIGRQLPFFALLLPFYAVVMLGGLKAIRGVWPFLVVAGGSFAAAQFVTSNFVAYELTDVGSSLVSLIVTVAFLKLWRPKPDPEFALAAPAESLVVEGTVPVWQGWLPWLIVAGVVIAWVTFKVNLMGQMNIPWQGLHNQVHITLYEKPYTDVAEKLYAAIWNFQPLATGTAILVSSVLTALCVGVGVKGYAKAMAVTWVQIRLAILTVMLIIGLAYLMNYSGLAYTLGKGVASAGVFFPMLSAFLGWLAVFLSGSDTSGNALFGNLQVAAARQLNLNPILFAATNSSGGVMGKLISPQNISTGCATSDLKGKEGAIFARTFFHSVFLTVLLGALVLLQQYVFSGMIPGNH